MACSAWPWRNTLRVGGFCPFADVSERVPYESRSDTEALGQKRIEHGLERRHQVRLPGLHEYSKRPAHCQSTLLRNCPADTLVDEQQISSKGLSDENRGRLARIQAKVCRRRGIVGDTNPTGFSKTLDAGRRRPSLDGFVPDGSRYYDVTEERWKDVEQPEARKIDERRAVGNDQHAPVQRLFSRIPPSSRLKSSTS